MDELEEKPEPTQELTLFDDNYEAKLNTWNFRRLLSRKYTIVCTNPPYLNKYNAKLKDFVNGNYKDYSGDLFSVFIYWDEMPYKEKVTDGRGKLDVAYMGSRSKDNKGEFFICLKKHDVFQIHEPEIVPGVVYPIDGPMGCEQLEPYKECEMAYLYKVFALLHLFHEGNIGFYEIFFDYTYKTLGAINNKVNHISQSRSRNIVDQRRYILSEQAQGDCNQFLIDYKGLPFSLLKTSIDEFVWGMEQIDIPTGFEQYTTALEMTLLEKDAQNKKKMLANRVATAECHLQEPEVAEQLLGNDLYELCQNQTVQPKLLARLKEDARLVRQLFQSAYVGDLQEELLEACDWFGESMLKEHLQSLLAQNPHFKEFE